MTTKKTAVKSSAAKPARVARKKTSIAGYISRTSQATKAAPSVRLKARRKAAVTAPEGYFPNPRKPAKWAPKFIVQWKLTPSSDWRFFAGSDEIVVAESIARHYASYNPVPFRVITSDHKG